MGAYSQFCGWIRSLGRGPGSGTVETVGESERLGAPASRESVRSNRGLEVAAEARRLRDNIRGSTVPITAGELSRRAERRLRLVTK